MNAWKRFLIFVGLIGVVALLGAACGGEDSTGNVQVGDDGDTIAVNELDARAVEGTTYVADAAGIVHVEHDGQTIAVDELDARAVEGATYVANAADIVSAVDWDSMLTVTVGMSDFIFTPESLTLEAGQPYKLELVNVGATKHYFTAEGFYQSVAFRKAQTSEGEFKAPYFKAIEVFPGDQVDLYFVPLIKGVFGSLCTIDGHEEAGMLGTIIVTGDLPASLPSPVMAAVAEGNWVQNATDLVSDADWDAMLTVRVDMSDFTFTPESLTLKAGQPYKLEIVNTGTVKHYFTAGEFYQTAAFRKVQDNSGEIKAPYFKAVEIFPGEQADLYLIPTKVDTYRSVCTITGHEDAGMHGTIVVEASN